jgi:aspartate-semialdehyde dehydrogenase
MTKKLRVGIVGATGMVGQRFVTLLENHPWFETVAVAASPQSAGKRYADAVQGRWSMKTALPNSVANLIVRNASDVSSMAKDVDFVFCAVDMKKDETLALEEAYAKAEIPVVSNNSATRMMNDVPMVVPELNPEHLDVIHTQRKRLGTKRGFIAVKPNCSLQSYVPALHPLRQFGINKVLACTYQSISGAGKTFETWPEMVDNVIPFISGEEQKSEIEPLKIWGDIKNGVIENTKETVFATQCIRVPTSDGHMAAVFVSFEKKPTREQILATWSEWQTLPQTLALPSAPAPFLKYFEEDNRPQTRLDRDLGNGMAVSAGRLREDPLFDYKFDCLSHNTVRGAAGGAVLIAELLKAKGWLD